MPPRKKQEPTQEETPAQSATTPELEPLIVHDTLEHWIVYPEDRAYLMALKIAPDEKGVRHVLPEVTEGLHTWWWRNAVEKAEKIIEDLVIPWGDLIVNDIDIADGNLMNLSGKLAKTAFYIVQCNNRLTRLLALQTAAKDMLDHAVNRNLGREEPAEGRKPALDVRRAVMISKDKRLRNMKIELIEAGAAIQALETTKESLDVLWRTCSRVLSARLKEPLD